MLAAIITIIINNNKINMINFIFLIFFLLIRISLLYIGDNKNSMVKSFSVFCDGQ